MSILRYLGLGRDARAGAGDPRAETESVRKIVAQLDRMDPARARFTASFAYILSRVAYADRTIDADETARMETMLVEHAGLDEGEAVVVVQMAKSQNLLFGGTEDFVVTREFAGLATLEQKRALLRCLFAVSAADASVTADEDRTISQIAAELKLDRTEVAAARAQFREFLAVLRPGRDDPDVTPG